MPTKLNNLNFFMFQDCHSSVSRLLRDGGILQCHVRVGAPSLFGGKATSDLALNLFCVYGPEAPSDRTGRFFQYALEVRGSNSAPVADRNRFVNFVSFCGIHGSKSKRPFANTFVQFTPVIGALALLQFFR